MSDKVYEPCKAVLEVYPIWTYCEKPTRIGGDGRCGEHPLRIIWPGE